MLKNLFMIVAATENTRAIGIDGGMLYHLREDLKYFKNTTLGHTVICGKNTFFSLPNGALPGRKNIVLSRSNETFKDAYTMNSKEEVLEYAKNNPQETIFIIGGDNVYAQFINHASKLYVTEIEENTPPKADVFFPKFDKNHYNIIQESDYVENPKGPRYKFVVYERKENY